MYAPDSYHYDYDDRDYERFEEENKIIAKQKRELEDNEEAFDRLRDNLEKVIECLSGKASLDLNSLNLSLASMCSEIGVTFDLANIQRATNTGVYLRS